MAILGAYGKIVLSRSAPTPIVVNISELNQDKNIIPLSNPELRSGDLVEVASVDNWPNANLNDDPLIPSYANIFDYQDYAEMVGYSTPYSAGLLRPFQWLSTENNDALITENGSIIAAQVENTSIPYRNRLYVHVDALNRLSFYLTRGASLNGANDATRVDISQSAFTLDPSGQIELRLVNEWQLEADLQTWSLNLNASEIDTTGLGDQFFDGVKSLVQGGGTFDFLIEREMRDSRNTAIVSRSEYANAYVFFGAEENTTYNDAVVTGNSAGATAYDNANITPAPVAFNFDTTPLARLGTSNLLRLLLNTSEQAEAEAEFWMIDSNVENRNSYTDMLQPGDLYYKAQIMLTSTAINVGVTDVITGSANFVTVRDVQLREG